MELTAKQMAFVSLANENGFTDQITRQNIKDLMTKFGIQWPSWLMNDESYRIGRGLYRLPQTATVDNARSTNKVVPLSTSSSIPFVPAPVENQMAAKPDPTNFSESLVPARFPKYVPFGNFEDVESIIKSKRFYPMYITGLSGNGKTMMVEQVCAKTNREMVRVNITAETDEDDLIGGFRLIDGHTVWHNGPVVMAMERGAVLLLDEVDLGSIKLMCLQPVLEGKSIFLKKINKLITPASGFTVVATANTKGKGSDDGRFIGTNVMNEAFLERFSITLEQEYPPANAERRILINVLEKTNDEKDKNFVDLLIKWADAIRRTFYDGGVNEIISTRRLVHICEAYMIFKGDRKKAIQLCLNRFDVDTKTSFMDLYTKIDAEVVIDPAGAEATVAVTPASSSQEIEF